MSTHTIRLATEADHRYIRHLQNQHHTELGFIPDLGSRKELRQGNVVLGAINDSPAGFLMVRPALQAQPTTAAIIQTAVELDARRGALGRQLVGRIARLARAAGAHVLQASCREDLEACAFWTALGFELVATRPGGSSTRHAVRIYRHALRPHADIWTLPTPHQTRQPGGRFGPLAHKSA